MPPFAKPGRPAFLPGKARPNPQTGAALWPPAQHSDHLPGDRRSLNCPACPQQLHQPGHETLTDASAAALPSNETTLEAAGVTPMATLEPAAAVGMSGKGQVAQGLQQMHLEQPAAHRIAPEMAGQQPGAAHWTRSLQQPSASMDVGSMVDGKGPLLAATHSAHSAVLPAGNFANLVRQQAGAAHPLPGPQARSPAAQRQLLSAASMKETAQAAPRLKLEPTDPQPHMLGAPSRPTTQSGPSGPQHHMLPAAATAKALEAAAAALSPQPAVAAAAPVARDSPPEGWGAALVQCSLSGLRYHLGCLPAPAQEVGHFPASTFVCTGLRMGLKVLLWCLKMPFF